jgi:hypothetical protein
MFAFRNPAMEAFVASLGSEMVFGQVCIRGSAVGHELCHVADRNEPFSKLRLVAPDDLRALAQSTHDGAFRPLKSAPNLQAGWLTRTRNTSELERALDHLYPGAIADWYAAREVPAPVTGYREFTARQTGMYRITTMLSDTDAAEMIQACCDVRVCLKRRLWTVQGLEPDGPAEKSCIPCLEPCAILLEFARKVVRMGQEEKVGSALSPSELETIRESLTDDHSTAASPREADFNAPGNPRREQLVLRRIQRMLAEAASRPPSSGDSEG